MNGTIMKDRKSLSVVVAGAVTRSNATLRWVVTDCIRPVGLLELAPKYSNKAGASVSREFDLNHSRLEA